MKKTIKVDGITLLQMIRDGKIKDNTLIKVSGGFRVHYPYIKFGLKKRLYWENEEHTINQAVLSDDLLEFDFEIIEEDEKPKEIDEVMCIDTRETRDCIIKFQVRLNELTKAVNYLLKKEDDSNK